MGNDSKPERDPSVAKNSWAWPTAWMVVVLVLVSGAVYVFQSCRKFPGEVIDKSGRVVDSLGKRLVEVAAAFRRGTVTTTFRSYAASLSGSQYLQFATLTQIESFTRKDESSVAFGHLSLPDVIVEATAPVTFTYYLDFNDRWDLLIQNGSIVVVAPDIKYNPPAVDVSRITYEVKKNSIFRNTGEAMENLRRSITSLSDKQAQAKIELVRETGRKQTQAFVQTWLVRSFADGKNYPVKVQFRSEVESKQTLLPQKKG